MGAAAPPLAIAERICRDVAELPDRRSPDDWPDAMLVTADELHGIVMAALGEETTCPLDRLAKPETIEEQLQEVTVQISRGDLERLDRVITFVDAMAGLFSDDFYDDLWNMRNGMVPFQLGEEHYDSEIGGAD